MLARGFGYVRLPQIDARALASEPVHVGLVQGNMPLVQSRDDHAESLRRHLRMTEELRQKGADFAVWSEVGGDVEHPRRRLRQFPAAPVHAAPEDPGALRGAPGRARSRHFRAYNVALASDREGHVVGRYDKHFLLAFGEYLPFGETFPASVRLVAELGAPHSGHFGRAGHLAGHSVTALVCYETSCPASSTAR